MKPTLLIEKLRRKTVQANREQDLKNLDHFEKRVNTIIEHLTINAELTAKVGGSKWEVFEFNCDKKLFRKVPKPTTQTQEIEWHGVQRIIYAIEQLGLNHYMTYRYSYGFDTHVWKLYVSWE